MRSVRRGDWRAAWRAAWNIRGRGGETAGGKDLPKKLLETAWRRTMEALSKINIENTESVSADTLSKFNSIYQFFRGDMSSDIYRELIHNENNMRPKEINGLFKLSGLDNVCRRICDIQTMNDFFDETDAERTNGRLVSAVEAFFERRNQTAHSINTMRSSGPEDILRDIELLRVFGRSLVEVLDKKFSLELAV